MNDIKSDMAPSGPRPRGRDIVAICTVIGAVLPRTELWLDCRDPNPDGCGWSRSLLPYTMSLSAFIGMMFGLLLRYLARRR
jgi:hypothetical protein